MSTEPSNYFERQGWDARAQGKPRLTTLRGPMGADFRKGWDARDRFEQSQKD